MRSITITPHADETYVFNGELLQDYRWAYANIAFSGYTRIYKTDTNKLVVEIKRWVDEHQYSGGAFHECVVLDVDHILSLKDNTWIARILHGNPTDHVLKQITKKFPKYMCPYTVFDMMVNIILYHLGLNPKLIQHI